MLKHAQEGYSTATDLADYLVSKSVLFREAHEIVGKAVAKAISKNKGFTSWICMNLMKKMRSL